MKRFIVLFALVAALAGPAVVEAGRWPGPGFDIKTVPGFSKVIYHDTFYGNEVAIIDVVGDRRGNLEILVFDTQGNLVARSLPGLAPVVSFTPNQLSRFRIEVHNLSPGACTYSMITN